jgi:vesicle coat complex subunit
MTCLYLQDIEPLLSTLSGATSELSYSILKHIQLIIPRAPELFAPDYKRFYCRYNDQAYLKLLKLDILTELAPHSAAQDIVDELG